MIFFSLTNRAELLTRGTVWVAICAYAIGAGMMLLAKERHPWLALARWIWTLGCLSFLAHVVCAFHYYQHWSHEAAYRETARQTAESTGLPWGGGLYLNYLFALAWVADVLWWWRDLDAVVRRPAWVTRILHGFLFFMIFNGAVIFATSPARWFGAAICGALAILWLLTRRHRLTTHIT